MKNGLIEYFVGNPVAARLLMVFLILGGIIAGLNIHVRQIPDLDFRTIVVTLASSGSSPREIEEDINRRIEESVLGLEGVDRVVSVASEGLARVEVEIETFADADAVLADVKNAVDSIENFPPPSARPPRIEHKRLSVEVLTLAVSSSNPFGRRVARWRPRIFATICLLCRPCRSSDSRVPATGKSPSK